MSESCPPELVTFAERLADSAAGPLRAHFRTRVPVDLKPDETPVTAADRDAEAAMRALIEAEHPDHGIMGEEHGTVREAAEFVWVLDPIDGTKSFITGKPMFGTLIALVRAGRPVLGIINQPVLGERWLGVAGRRTVFNGAPAETRACADLGAAVLNATAPDMFEGGDAVAFARLSGRTRHALFGGDCYAYGLLASGFIDLVVEAKLQPYDFCALAPVVEGAGGAMADWRGGALTLASDGRVIAAGDRTLLPHAVEVLAGG